MMLALWDNNYVYIYIFLNIKKPLFNNNISLILYYK